MAINQAANAAVQAAIGRAIVERGEIGVQVAAYLHGELVIDAWGGLADPATGRTVDGATLFNVYSVQLNTLCSLPHRARCRDRPGPVRLSSRHIPVRRRRAPGAAVYSGY